MGKKLKINGLWTQFLDPLEALEPFDTHGALRGDKREPGMLHGWGDGGRLSKEYMDSYAHSSYAVYSYQTPIAWLDENGDWISPDVKYSVTTSKHQGRINTAISVMVK